MQNQGGDGDEVPAFPEIVPLFGKKAFAFFQTACVFFQKAAPQELYIYTFCQEACLLPEMHQ